MFDLEKAILNWIRVLRRNPSFEDGDIVEIEDHIREEIENEHTNGLPLKKAFKSATSSFGSVDSIGDEMTRSRTKHLKIPHRYSLELEFPESKNPFINFTAMFRNYLIIAIRNLMKQKLHSFINIAGLAIGMVVSILILSYVWYEFSFDQFHSKYDQIYRVVHSRHFINESNRGTTGQGLASALKEEFPEIINIARLNDRRFSDFEISYKEKKFIVKPRKDLVLADNDIFKIFDIDLVHGDPETALQDPNSIILTEEESGKYFGDENPIGKFIKLQEVGEEEQLNLKVTGIAKAMPSNSHFEFKYLIPHDKFPSTYKPFVGYGYDGCTYLTLPVGYPPENLEIKFPGIIKKYYTPGIEDWVKMTYDEWLESGGYWKLGLQPLKNIHLDNYYKEGSLSPVFNKGNLFRVRIYMVVALFIIVLACINFITLSTARSGARAKEVGVRKVIGAKRVQLIWQFLTESIMLSVIALVCAVIMVTIFSKPLNNLLEIQTSHNNAGIVFIVTSLFIVTLIVGVIAGSYPAFFLSAFRPVNVLKGKLLEKMRGMKIRNSLVVFQFMVSIILIISSIAVYKQFIYMQNKDLGFDKENIVIINMHGLYRSTKNLPYEEKEFRYATLRQEALKNANVINASFAQNMPGLKGYGWYPLSVHPEGATPETRYSLNVTLNDYAYLDVFGLEMAAGRNFKTSLTIPQTSEGVIINEKAANHLGWKNPVGKYLEYEYWIRITNSEGENDMEKMDVQSPVIGVFKDFHNDKLHVDINPTIFFPVHKGDYGGNYLAVRFLPSNISDNIAFLEKTWNKFTEEPFDYSFFDKELEIQYIQEKKLAHIFTFFCILAIFIACLGIFGLANFTAEQRTKEIGIRKVFGASIGNIVKILSKIYLKLLMVAILIACPLAYIIMSKWLQNFAFRTKLEVAIFIYTGLITTIIVLSSVSYHTIKAALKNPANTLKYE